MKKGRFVLVAVACVAALVNVGCVSRAVYKGSEQKARAIRAVEVHGGAGIGLDLTALDVISQRPWMQLGAAVVDAGMIYGAYRGLDALQASTSGSDDDRPNTTQNIRADTVIIGDGSSATVDSSSQVEQAKR